MRWRQRRPYWLNKNRAMSRYGLLLVSILLATPVFSAPVSEDPLERRMLDIAKDLRCAVCQNQPVSESNADLARDVRRIIREQLEAGKSREEIIAYFVERYGDFILLKPRYQGAGLVIWVLPLGFVLILGIPAFVFIRRRLRAQLPPPPELSEEDAARVREARRQEAP